MKLDKAVSYFINTPVSGWNGLTWVANAAVVKMLGFDRFISVQEFGNKRRHILVPVSDNRLDSFSAIRFDDTGDIYLVGVKIHDIDNSAYSKIYLIHQANKQGDVVSFTKTMAASGTVSSVVRQSIGSYYCDAEHLTFTGSQIFDTVKYSQVILTFPSNCPVDTDNEVVIGTDYYDVREVYKSSGFVVCRAMKKRSK